MEYLIDFLIKEGRNIKPIRLSLLKRYGDKLKKEYSQVLDTISIEAPEGNILKLEKYIRNKINGFFYSTLENFVEEYEKDS